MAQKVSQSEVEEITELSESFRNGLWQSYLNCGPVSIEIQERLVSEGYDASVVIGTVTQSPNKDPLFGSEHAWIELRAGDTTIIVDGTLDQFCMENYDDGRVDTALGPREELGPVAVLTPNDDLYDHFHKDEQKTKEWC